MIKQYKRHRTVEAIICPAHQSSESSSKESSSDVSEESESKTKDSDVFQSDDSYYDETEDFEPFSISQEEVKEKKLN